MEKEPEMAGGTQLGKVRGLGSANHGGDHWINQRFTALGNLILMIWLVASLLRLPDFSYTTIANWLSTPQATIPFALLILCVLSHIKLGLQIVLEDYVHDEGLKFASLFALKAYCWGVGGFALFALARIAFSGTAN
jgi:succinate dehydrogenase / fumarate reductase, membrane anchor subunit